MDCIASGTFWHQQKDLFRPLVDSLLNHDPFMVLADYQSYVDCQTTVGRAYRDREHWVTMSILNTARMGRFSSDRAIQEYCRDIWDIQLQPQHRSFARNT
jgi:starch phosphorylase